ncbi:MTP-1 family protein [Paenibacillus sp. FSL E2-8871]|uniref:MTP-1 family protein n=1 Tax=Paenibacillus sp. FSL E2-8871 TaxID=2975326 RepID=UPI004046B9EF
MKLLKNAVKTCEQLLMEYAMKEVSVTNTQKLTFTGVDHKDVYNITAPFQDEGEWVIAGRVESRDSEHSDVVFFVERDGQWVPREGAPTLELQDPFFTKINGELIVGGVQIYPHPVKADALMWRTVFYRGKNIASLEPFFKGPDGMKDLRLVDLKDSIGVLTRPQGDKGGRGKIGFTRIASLEALSIPLIEEIPLLDGQFVDEEWGGANEAHLLKNGLLGVLGHIASFDDSGDRHYYPMVFAIDPATGEYSDIQLIAVRNQFLPGVAKRPDLEDVVFSGGLVRHEDGTANIYAGISDAEAQRATIPDPFAQFEKL